MAPIWVGIALMTLGTGLFINLGATTNWPKIIIYQAICGLGIGPLFQAPLIALQSLIKPRDIATATATFGFTRTLASAIGVVIGQVVFQNEMRKRSALLTTSLGAALASRLGGGNAGANTQVISGLPGPERAVARQAFASSLSVMWIVYVVFSACGLLAAVGLTKQGLDKSHEETETGLEAQEKARLEAKREDEERRQLKRDKAAARASGEGRRSKEEA